MTLPIVKVARLSSRTLDMTHETADKMVSLCPFKLELIYASETIRRYKVTGE